MKKEREKRAKKVISFITHLALRRRRTVSPRGAPWKERRDERRAARTSGTAGEGVDEAGNFSKKSERRGHGRRARGEVVVVSRLSSRYLLASAKERTRIRQAAINVERKRKRKKKQVLREIARTFSFEPANDTQIYTLRKKNQNKITGSRRKKILSK